MFLLLLRTACVPGFLIVVLVVISVLDVSIIEVCLLVDLMLKNFMKVTNKTPSRKASRVLGL